MKRRNLLALFDGVVATTWPLGRPNADASPDGRALPAVRPGLVVLLCVGAGLLSVSFGTDNYWDLRFYHLYAPWAYLHGRYLYDIGPAQYQGFFNPTADFLFYALTSSALNGYPRLVAFIMGAVHGINGVLIAAIVLQVLHPLQSRERVTLRVVAVLLGLSGAGFISLLGTTSNDLINSIFVLAALLCILKTAAADGHAGAAWRGLAWAGLWAGVAVGLKYTAAVFVPGLALAAVLVALRHRRRIGGPAGGLVVAFGLVVFGLAATLGFLAVAGHHLLTLWQDFGNPVFPLFNDIFQSPFYEAEPLLDDQFLPDDVWQMLFNPFYWTTTNTDIVTELPFREWRGAIAYVAMVAAMLAVALPRLRWIAQVLRFERLRAERLRAQPSPETRGLQLVFLFVIVSYLVWEFVFDNYRYAVVLEMLTGVVSMGAVIHLVANPSQRVAAALAVMALATVTTVHLDWGHVPFGERTIDVRVPPLPPHSVVLLATWQPASYFIPFAEPTARYVGIENNYLELEQDNKLATEAKRLMQTPGPRKFVLSVGDFDADALNALLANLALRLGPSPCRPIWSNLMVDALSLCEAVER